MVFERRIIKCSYPFRCGLRRCNCKQLWTLRWGKLFEWLKNHLKPAAKVATAVCSNYAIYNQFPWLPFPLAPNHSDIQTFCGKIVTKLTTQGCKNICHIMTVSVSLDYQICSITFKAVEQAVRTQLINSLLPDLFQLVCRGRLYQRRLA